MSSIHELRKIPYIRFVIPLITGLLTGSKLNISLGLIIGILCLLIIFFPVILFINKLSARFELRLVFGAHVNIFILVAGFLLIKSRSDYSDHIATRIKNSEYYLCRIINQPEQKSESVRALLKIIGYKDSVVWNKCNINLIAYFRKDSNSARLSIGEVIILKCRLREISNCKNPCEFDYKKYMESQGIKYRIYVKTGTWQTVGRYNDLKTGALKLRNKLLDLYRKYGITDNEFAVLSAFTLGYRNQLNLEIRNAFVSAGAMHFMAISGLHVGIIYYVLSNLFRLCRKTKYTKAVKLVLIIIILWLYALLTGLSSSVTRACIMFTLIQAGTALNRTINIYNILAFAAFSILVCHPFEIYDTGFQLSFIAVLSIVFFQPLLYKMVAFKNKIPDKIWKLFSVSVSAQLGVFPIIIYYFHHFPVYFWLSNILIIFPLAASICLAVLLFTICPISQIALVIATILKILLKVINFIIINIEKLPGSLADNIYNNLFETILIYLIVISASMFILVRNRYCLKLSLFCLMLFLSVNFLRSCRIYRQKKIIVFNINKYTAISLINGRNNYLLTDIDLKKDDRILLNAAENYWLKHGVINISKLINTGNLADKKALRDNSAELYIRQLFNNIFVCFRDKNLLILNNTELFKYTGIKKYRLDYLIITNNIQFHMKPITNLFDIDTVVIDSSNDFRTQHFWVAQCKRNGIACNIVSVDGALEIELQ